MTAEWFSRKGDREVGPIDASQLKLMADSGQLSSTDLVRKGGQEQPWVKAGSVKGLFISPTPQSVGFPLSSDDDFFERLTEETADSSLPKLAAGATAASGAVAGDAASLDQVLQLLIQCRTAISHVAKSIDERPPIGDFTVGDWLIILFKVSLASALIALGIGVVAGIVLVITGVLR